MVRAIRNMPDSALRLIPFLVLPIVLGALYLALAPDSPRGRALLVLATVAVALYLVAGIAAAEGVRRGLRQRRDLKRIGAQMAALEVAAFAVSAEGTILAQNDHVPLDAGELVGRRIQDVLARSHADADGRWRNLCSQLARGTNPVAELERVGTFQLSRRPGATVQLWQAPVQDTEPEISAPIPESQNLQCEALPVAVLILDGASRIVTANAAAVEMLGQPVEGKPLASLFEGPGRSLGDWIDDISAGRLASGSEVLRTRGSATENFVQVVVRKNGPDSVIAVLSDANALKRLEAQFVQSQKMQAIGQLAGGIAHDFNNLLTAISGHCDLLMLRHDKGDPDYADLVQISQNTNRAAALVSQLLAYSRKQTLKLQMLDLRETLADLTHLLNRLVGERIVLTFHHDPNLHMIRADRRQLEQVIINLVVNARDAMPDGGDIAISTRNMRIANAEAARKPRMPVGDYVCVEVQDEGCGIPPEVVAKIFEPFFSTKRTGEGTGLGLSTAYGIVKQTGGYIFCDSVIDEGSRFSLYFPAHVGQVADAEETAAPTPMRHSVIAEQEQAPTILLVEDEAPVRAFASRALQLQGCHVLEAANAEDALELLSDQRLKVDVFVTDVVMPGLDGPSWVRAALRDRPATGVIFMSGYAEDLFADGTTPIEGAEFLAKPFSLSELTAMVGRQLERRKLGSGGR